MKDKEHLGDIITKEEAAKIVEYAIGREATEKELQESEVETIEEFLQTGEPEDKIQGHQMIIPLYQHEEYDYPNMRIVISINGLVQYQNWSGCTFPLLNPIEIYKIILSKEEKLKKLWESI